MMGVGSGSLKKEIPNLEREFRRPPLLERFTTPGNRGIACMIVSGPTRIMVPHANLCYPFEPRWGLNRDGGYLEWRIKGARASIGPYFRENGYELEKPPSRKWFVAAGTGRIFVASSLRGGFAWLLCAHEESPLAGIKDERSPYTQTTRGEWLSQLDPPIYVPERSYFESVSYGPGQPHDGPSGNQSPLHPVLEPYQEVLDARADVDRVCK
jgi:hypothetical protein